MCTFSLWRAPEDNEFAVIFNRDEKHARVAEQPPAARTDNRGSRYLAPLDGQNGGTWLLANHAGLVACVMNDYSVTPAEQSPVPSISRGLIPLSSSSASNVEEALESARTLLATHGGAWSWAPFYFFVFSRFGEGACLHWSGRELARKPASSFHSTSSHEPARVVAARSLARQALLQRNPTLEDLRAFHFSHDEQARAESIRMWRPDACTRSITEVVVSAQRVVMRHRSVDWNNRNASGTLTEVTL